MIEFKVSEYDVSAINFDLDNLRIHFVDDRFRRGVIDYRHRFLDLKQLVGMQIIYEQADMTARMNQAIAQTNRNRQSNALLGAVAGGVVDAMNGDDSIIDGVVIGGALGALVTPVEQINLKEQSKYSLLLLFKNGESAKCIVDRSGFVDLLRALHKVRMQYPDEPKAIAHCERELNPTELKIAADFNRNSAKADAERLLRSKSIAYLNVAAIYSLILSMGFLIDLVLDQRLSLSGRYYLALVIIGCVAWVMTLYQRRVETKKIKGLSDTSGRAA